MLYTTKQNEAYYYVAEPVGEVFYELYNFFSMSRTDQAVQSIIRWHFDLFQLTGGRPNADDRYTLVLDFLSNMRTPHITAVISRVVDYFTDQGFTPQVNEAPLRITISNLKIQDALTFIQDNDFQSINNAVSALHCSTWRLVKQG